jgi:CheY-like chemotaxis protein
MPFANILVADDDADIREVLMLALESYGYRVIGAADGEQALRLLRLEPAVSVVLLDLMMPILDGPGFMKRLKADPTLPAVSVVVLSGDSAAVETSTAIGADTCLTKPVDLDSLLHTIRRFVGLGRRAPDDGAVLEKHDVVPR